MYQIETLKTAFFIIIVLLMLIFFLLAIYQDKKNQKNIKEDITLKEEEIYYECLKESNEENKDIKDCIRKANISENQTRDIIELNLKNISLTKRMINSSLEGAIRGGIFGFIISKFEGAFVGIILFAALNPVMKYVQLLCVMDQNLI